MANDTKDQFLIKLDHAIDIVSQKRFSLYRISPELIHSTRLRTTDEEAHLPRSAHHRSVTRQQMKTSMEKKPTNPPDRNALGFETMTSPPVLSCNQQFKHEHVTALCKS